MSDKNSVITLVDKTIENLELKIIEKLNQWGKIDH